MKKICMVFILLSYAVNVAQQSNDNKTNKSVLERLNLLEKKDDKLNISFIFQSSFNAVKKTGKRLESNFKTAQSRLDIRGNVTDKIFYRFNHRLNKNNTRRSLDNLGSAIDVMFVGYRFNDEFKIIAGKQCLSWGTFEFDTNPVSIYEYSDFINHMDGFMLGFNFVYNFNKKHEFQFQITNTRNSKFADIYGDLSKQGIIESKTPLTYILNWNGIFFDNKFKTRWASGLQTQAKGKFSKMITLGNKLNLKKFQITFDYLHANEDLDRLGIITILGKDYLKNTNRKVFENAIYDTYITRLDFQPIEKWNLFFKGMYEVAGIKKSTNFDYGFRKSYGYFTGVEYTPYKDQDLKLFLAYIGRKYNISGFKNYTTNRVSMGLIYNIKAF